MKELRSILKNVVLTLALAFVMTLAGSAIVKAELVTPAQITGLTQKSSSSSSVSIEWQAQLTNDVRYEAEISTDKVNWTSKGSASINSGTISGLNAGSTYYVRMRAYTSEYDTTVHDYVYAYGAYSDVLEVVTSPNSETSYIKKTNSTTNSITLEWAAVPGANTYCVVYKNGDAEKYVNVPSANTTAVTTTLTGLAANSEYTIYVYADRANSTGTYVAENSSYEYAFGIGVTPSKATGVEVPYYWDASKEIKVVCDEIACADGYETQVWTAYKKKDKKIATSASAYIKKNALGKHKFFKVRMRGYSLTTDGAKKYGAWSNWKYVCQQPDVTKMIPTGNGMQIKFDKIDGASRYTVYASTKMKSGYKKVGTTKKTSFKLTKIGKKKLKKGKTYHVYVVAEKKVGKKLVSGAAGNADFCWYQVY